MESWVHTIITVVCSVMASSGFWAFMQKRYEKKDVRTQILLGLGHDRILYLGTKYLEREWLTYDEYENINTYLYEPYEKLGGNGVAKKIIEEVRTLQLKDNYYKKEVTK